MSRPNVTVLRLLVACLIPMYHSSALLAQTSPLLNTYRLSRSSIVCVTENESLLQALTVPMIILDVSVCPPRGLGIESLVTVRDSGVPTADIKFRADGSAPDSLLIIPKAKLSCFLSTLKSIGKLVGDPVLADFSACIP
jgi:hypothetical protein